MPFSSQLQRNRHIVAKALAYLIEGELQLSQRKVVTELKAINVTISTANLNKAYREIENLGRPSLKRLAEGLPLLLEDKWGVIYSDEVEDFVKDETVEKKAILVDNVRILSTVTVYEKGRIRLANKVEFIKETKKEIIEIGVSLRTLTSYFISQNRFEYKMHIEALLKKGVVLKLFLLAPDSEVAKFYFADRNESKRLRIINDVIAELKKLRAEFEEKNFSGKLEIYTYAHFPTHHTLLIDRDDKDAKMLINPYLAGVRRAESPVLQFSKSGNPILYQKYLQSTELTLKVATLLD